MGYTDGRLKMIDEVIDTKPPDRLYQYTSPAGLLGIAKSKKLWATHIRFLNDSKELELAIDIAKFMLSKYTDPTQKTPDCSEKEIELAGHMIDHVGRASTGIYIASLTEERDLLSQWRAYCPPAGGYCIGFSADQLASVAKNQSFFLTPCVYENEKQHQIIRELINYHMGRFRNKMKESELDSKEIKNMGIDFARELSRFGTILKHKSFKEENEWRLISRPRAINHPSILHRVGKESIIPYVEFELITDEHPYLVRYRQSDSLLVVVGPTRDHASATYAVQSLGHAQFKPGWGHSRSTTPYRGS